MQSSGLDNRTTALESQQRSLFGQVEQLARLIQRIESKVDEGLGAITEKMSKIGRPQWGLVLTAAGLILTFFIATIGAAATVIVAASRGPVDDIRRLKDWRDQQTAQTAHDLRDRLDDVPGLLADAEARGRRYQQIDSNSANITALDINHQREMRDLDGAMEAKVDGADRRIQSEIATLFGDLRRQVDLLTDVLRETRREYYEQRAATAERLGRLEGSSSKQP